MGSFFFLVLMSDLVPVKRVYRVLVVLPTYWRPQRLHDIKYMTQDVLQWMCVVIGKDSLVTVLVYLVLLFMKITRVPQTFVFTVNYIT